MKTAALSDMETFPILASRMQQTGTALLKVVYRGYATSAQLQEMHEMAIAKRTKLRLEGDAAREEQEKRAMELRCREERSNQEQALEEKAARHKLAMLALSKQQERDDEADMHAIQLRQMKERAEAELEQERARHDEDLRRAKEAAHIETDQLKSRYDAEIHKNARLQELGVDLTKYLCALATVRPDHHYRIETEATPNVHLELSDRTAH